MKLENTSSLVTGGNIYIDGNGVLTNYGIISGVFKNISIDCSFFNFGKLMVNGSLLLLYDSTHFGQLYIFF